MEKPRVLSGEALVAKGITKIDASLPEIGLKDVTPNGSWLEQKQVQAALEARKYLVEVERIEKCGTLSHAEWRDDLMLAEVTQKAGGYWQYLGHNVGKTLYLRPEEALFLMEVNCLLLKHNEVIVSLQNAYSLLLNSSTTITQYKVYASLSRLGYRVFRHTGPKVDDTKNNDNNTRPDIKNVEPESVSMDIIKCKNIDSPTGTTNIFEVVDSPITKTKNKPKNDDFSIVSSKKESENVDLCIDCSVNNSGNVSLLNVTVSNEPAEEESSAISTTDDCEEAKSDATVDNTDSDGKTENIVIVETDTDSEMPATVTGSEMPATVTDSEMPTSVTDFEMPESVTDSEMTKTPKDDTIENPENSESQVEAQANQMIKKEQKQIPDQRQDKDSERNRDIVKMIEVKHSKEIVEPLDAENSVAKENDSPNVIMMEVNDFVEFKTAINKIETIEGILSVIAENSKNNENKIDSMDICTENQEAGVVMIMEENDDNISKCVEITTTEESTTITNTSSPSMNELDLVNTGSVTNGDCAKRLKEVPNKNDTRNSNKTIATKNKISQNNSYSKEHGKIYNYLAKLEKLTKRQLRPSDSKTMVKFFKSIPDLSRGSVFTINVPDQQFIPKNIYVNKAAYTLNLQNIVMRPNRSTSSVSPAYTSSDEVNDTNIRRIRNTCEALTTYFPQNPNLREPGRIPRNSHFRPYGIFRPQNNLNFCQLLYIQARCQYQQWQPRPPCFTIHPNNHVISKNARKKMDSGKTAHFQAIMNLAFRLKQSLITGNAEISNLETLHGLLHAYNYRYGTRLRLTDQFDVLNGDNIIETIELDDDEESKSKKPRLEKDHDDKFDENLHRLRQFALRLRHLKTKDEATTRHRRAFSKAIKTFNKSYNADVYFDDYSYEVIDRRFITLDSSSESDCVIEEQAQVRSKRLRNPFNILKRRKERQQSLNKPGTSKQNNTTDHNKIDPAPTEADRHHKKYSELKQTFNKNWLPNEKDFGRAEVVPKHSMSSRLDISNRELFLYDYMKNYFQKFKNWLEAKTSFLEYLEETSIAFRNQQAQIQTDSGLGNSDLKPLIDFEDSSDMPTLLEKLRIIENNKEIDTETSLRIDFDVYNRNVQNFRKRNPPKPNFRIICVDESSGVPPAVQIMSLHSKYEDDVPVVFAIVSTGSISYLQINPTDLPIYVPNNDLE